MIPEVDTWSELTSAARSAAGCGASEGHGFGDEAADALGCSHQVIVGHVSIASGGSVAAVSEQLPHQAQVLAGHDGMAGHDVSKVVKPRPGDAGADRMPSVKKPALARPVRGVIRERELTGVAARGQRIEDPTGGGPALSPARWMAFGSDVAPAQ